MKTMPLSILLAAALCVATTAAARISFPVLMWSEKAFDDLNEYHARQNMELVVDTLKTSATASGAEIVMVVVGEALTSQHFAENAISYPFIKSQVAAHAQLYTRLVEPFNTASFSALFGESVVQTYTLQSEVDLETLTTQLTSDLTASEQAQKVVLVIVKESVAFSELDNIVKQVQLAATSVHANTLMALTGNAGSGTHLINLLQGQARLLDVAVGDVDPNIPSTAGIMFWLYPSVLSALLICLFILSILIFGFLQLFYVQTPEVFVNTSIDFGKIEK